MNIPIRSALTKILYFLILIYPSVSLAQHDLHKFSSRNSDFFIENKGQWDHRVKYLARLTDMNVWITETGVVYDFFRTETNAAVSQDPFSHDPNVVPDTNNFILGHVINMTFTRKNNKIGFSGSGKLKYYYNYFLGNDPEKWTSYVSLFKEVTAAEIYPGIDARFYLESGRFRYDLIVKPGADISGFRLKFEGQQGISLNEKGDLLISTSIGNLLNGKLFAYQELNAENKSVSCKFISYGNEFIGFELGKYDHNKPLIIDPLVYSTYLGGNRDDQLQSMVVDKFRNAYVAGVSGSTNYPTTAGAYKTTRGLFRSGVITELDAGGFPVFSTYIGDSTLINDIAIDTIGNVYVTGWTGSHNYPTTAGVLQPVSKEPGAGGAEGFVSKLNASGTALVYSTYLGGSGFDIPTRIKVDKLQNAFITGYTFSNNFPLSNGALQIIKSGSSDCFVTKLDRLGKNLIYSTFLGGKSVDVPNDIEIDSIGNSYIVGRTQSSDFYTTSGSFQPDSIVTPVMGFLSKINRFGTNMIFSTFLAGKGGSGLSNNVTGVDIDTSGCAYVTGYTSSDSFPVTTGALKTTTPSSGKAHAFITKFDNQGISLVYSTYFGGNNDDFAYDINVDPLGNAIIGGATNSTNLPFTNDAVQKLHNGNSDLFAVMVNPYGTKLFYTTYLGGSGLDYLSEIFYDSSGNIYLDGQAVSDDFPVTSGAYQQTKGSPCGMPCYGDGFVSRINIDPPTIITDPVSGFPACAGTYISVPYSVRSLFDTNNIFYLELSDTSGSFTSALTIGAKSSRTSGSITGQLPVSLKYGTKYRFRVVASSPAVTGSDNGSGLTIDSATIRSFLVSDTIGCLNANSFSFSFDTSYLSQFTAYRWNFGDGDTSGLQNPLHSYKTADTFIVSLELTNKLSCTDTITKRIIVFPSPKASFSVADSLQCFGGNKFDFINASTIVSGNLSQIWIFDDGDSAFTTDASHSYLFADTFRVKLQVISDWSCSDSFIKSVYITPGPKADFSTPDTVQCLSGNNFPFYNYTQNPGGSILSFNWTFGDGATDTASNPVHSYVTDSVYTVRLSVSSVAGCNDSITRMVVVGPEPKASFSVNDTMQCLSGNSFVFSNHSAIKNPGLLHYTWNLGDGNTDTAANPVHSYTSDGLKTVQLNAVSDLGCKDSALLQVTVFNKPAALFSVNDSDQCLTGNSFVFKNLTTKPGTALHPYLWKFGDGNSDTAANPVHSYMIADTFTVELSAVSDIGCSDTFISNVVVYPMPIADFSVNTNPQPLAGNNFVFTNLSNTFNQGTPSWLWDFGDAGTSTQYSPSHSYTRADTFYVTLYATTGKGCKDTITKKIWLTNILPQFWVDFMTENACKGEYVLFTNTSTIKNDSFLNFFWDFGDGSVTIVRNNPRHMYADTGTYLVKLTGLTYGGFKDSVTYPVQVMPKPNLRINYSPDTILVKGSIVTLTAIGTYDSIFWSTGAQTSSIEVDSTDLYSVRIVDQNGCDSSGSIHVLFYEDEPFSAMTVITPNGDGINDLWKIFGIEKYQPCKLAIYNNWGDELYSSSDYQNNWDGKYKGKPLPAGSYYFVLKAKDGKVFKGVVNVYN